MTVILTTKATHHNLYSHIQLSCLVLQGITLVLLHKQFSHSSPICILYITFFFFCSCCNNVPQIGCLKTTETHSIAILGARSLKDLSRAMLSPKSLWKEIFDAFSRFWWFSTISGILWLIDALWFLSTSSYGLLPYLCLYPVFLLLVRTAGVD